MHIQAKIRSIHADTVIDPNGKKIVCPVVEILFYDSDADDIEVGSTSYKLVAGTATVTLVEAAIKAVVEAKRLNTLPPDFYVPVDPEAPDDMEIPQDVQDTINELQSSVGSVLGG